MEAVGVGKRADEDGTDDLPEVQRHLKGGHDFAARAIVADDICDHSLLSGVN